MACIVRRKLPLGKLGYFVGRVNGSVAEDKGDSREVELAQYSVGARDIGLVLEFVELSSCLG
jgi:hypothetical protein